jgi:hypothetical protein
MTVSPVSLNITTPTEPIAPSRGFYQLEEEALFVQVGPFTSQRRFYSYLESPGLCLDFDRQGRLIFIEVSVSRRKWSVVNSLKTPRIIEPADIRWLDFRDTFLPPALETNSSKTLLKLSFGASDDPLNYYLAKSVIAQTDRRDRLLSLWVTDITDDIAGRAISFFRKDLRANQSYYA